MDSTYQEMVSSIEQTQIIPLTNESIIEQEIWLESTDELAALQLNFHNTRYQNWQNTWGSVNIDIVNFDTNETIWHDRKDIYLIPSGTLFEFRINNVPVTPGKYKVIIRPQDLLGDELSLKVNGIPLLGDNNVLSVNGAELPGNSLFMQLSTVSPVKTNLQKLAVEDPRAEITTVNIKKSEDNDCVIVKVTAKNTGSSDWNAKSGFYASAFLNDGWFDMYMSPLAQVQSGDSYVFYAILPYVVDIPYRFFVVNWEPDVNGVQHGIFAESNSYYVE
jgi:hypothetical protein